MIFGVLLFEEVEELDFVGPWEVFGDGSPSAASRGRDVVRMRATLRVHGFITQGRFQALAGPWTPTGGRFRPFR